MKKTIMVVAMATLVMASCSDAKNVNSTLTVDSTAVMQIDSTKCVDSCAEVVETVEISKIQK